MSESPERPRLTRRQLREMERAQSEAQQESSTTSSGDDAEASEPVSETAAPVRPTLTRRQLREAAAREEAARQEAAQQEAAPRGAAQQDASAPEVAGVVPEPRVDAVPEVEPLTPTGASKLRLPPRESFRASTPADPGAGGPSQVESKEAAEVLRSLAEGHQSAPQDDGNQVEAAPTVRPPAGVRAIRTVEETGELSPIINTAPGGNGWIPGSDTSAESSASADSSAPSESPQRSEALDGPEDPMVTTGKQVPFRAPAWGARTLAAEQAAAGLDQDSEVKPGQPAPQGQDPQQDQAPGSGMRSAATRWPASGQFGTGPVGQSPTSRGFPTTGGTSFSGLPSGQFPTGGVPATNFYDDYELDDEEYEPMFTWLRVLVLLVVAFTLGVLVWLIIGKEDPNSGAAAIDLVTDVKNSLGV